MTDLFTRDALAAVAWGAANLLLAAAGWRLGRRLAPEDPPTARVIHAIVFGWAAVVGVATLLGLCQALTPLTVLAGVAAVAAVALWYGAGGAAAAPVGPADRAVLIGWLVLLAYWLGRVACDGLLRFPTDWDALMYHIPLVDQWLQTRSLYAPRDATWYNPGNNELMGLWAVAPFSGDFLIGLNNLPAGMLLSLGGVELARQAGAGRAYACLGGLAVVASYVVFRQLTDAENDVAAAGLFLASIYYALRHARSGGRGTLLLGAAAVGLLAGVKYYALGFGVVAGTTLVVGALLARGPRPAARAAAVGLLGALLLGGYWYLRNAWLTGTPLYPKGYNAQTDLMAQWRTGIWGSTLLGSGRPEVLPLATDAVWRMAGPCHVLAFLAAPLTAGWLVASGLGRERLGDPGRAGALRVALALALAGAGLVWGCIPFAIETTPGTLNALRGGYIPVRFGLSFLSLSVVALALLLHDLGSGLGRLAARLVGWTKRAGRWAWPGRTVTLLPGTAFGVAAGYQFFRQATRDGLSDAPLDGLLVGVNVGVLMAIGSLCRRSWPGARRRIAVGAAVGLLTLGAVAAEQLAQRWHAEFSRFYDRLFGVTVYSRLAARDPATTSICSLNYRYYPFFGSRRQFRVARPLWVPTYDALGDYLRAHDSTVVVAILHDPFPNGRYREAHRWLAERSGLFPEIQRDWAFLICAVDRVRLGDLAPETPSPGP